MRGEDIIAVKKWGNKPVSHIQGLPFAEKRTWFRQQMERLRVPWTDGHTDLKLRRQNFTEVSFNKVEKLSQKEMRSNFRFEIEGETKLSDDAGGVTREWFQIMTKEIFDVEKGLFEVGTSEDVCYQVNELSGMLNERHLNWFYFTGRMMAKALFDGMCLPAHLSPAMYMHILQQEITFEDFKKIDPAEHRALEYMRNQPIAGVFDDLTFTITQDRLGEKVEVNICPDGSQKAVTEANKKEYTDLKVKYLTYTSKTEQIERFRRAFWEVVPLALLRVFNAEELHQEMCGTSGIDLKDWQANTLYLGSYAPSHQVIKWYWQRLETYTPEQLSKVLQFITASTVVPITGFKGLQGSRGEACPFTIENVPYTGDGFSLQLPKAHTCFNKLDLPLYPSKEVLAQSLEKAMEVESVGFYHE